MRTRGPAEATNALLQCRPSPFTLRDSTRCGQDGGGQEGAEVRGHQRSVELVCSKRVHEHTGFKWDETVVEHFFLCATTPSSAKLATTTRSWR